MTTIRQLIQSSPVKAKELFAKLADTSENAVKTRDRLFSELKDELELQAELQEQHLFPVLKKHEGTKGLVTDALNDNRETRKLMAELEKIPKDSEEFGGKVAEIQKVFQQHVRDEKKEFLPAVVKALSDEEASTVVEKIEDEKAEVEAAQRAEAKERRAKAAAERAKAKQEREQVEAAKAANDKAKAEAERARKDSVAAQTGASAVAKKSDDETEQSEAAGAAGQAEGVVETGARTGQQGATVTRTVTRAGADEAPEMRSAETDTASAGRSMVELLNEQAQHAMQATMAVGRARTLADVTKAQSDFIGGSFQRMGQFNDHYRTSLLKGMISVSRLSSDR